MKRMLTAIVLCICLAAMPAAALAAGDITVTVSPSSAEEGDSLTVSGTALPDTWISIQGTDEAGNILCFSAVLSDASGAYSETFIVPAVSGDTLTLTAGSGSISASATVKIDTPSGGDTDSDNTANNTAPPTASAQAVQSAEASEAPINTASALVSAAPVSTSTAAEDIAETEDNPGNAPVFIWILAGIFVLLLAAGAVLFLRIRGRGDVRDNNKNASKK